MNYFSVPSDYNYNTIDELAKLNQKYSSAAVSETYGQVSIGSLLHSGRVVSSLVKIDFKELEAYVNYSRKENISFNYTVNPSCFGNMEFDDKGIGQIIHLFRTIESIGIEKVTITMPSLVEILRNAGLSFQIKTSAICEITTPLKAEFYKKLGAERIVVDPDITRSFRTLKSIAEIFGSGVEIIINNMCFKDCAYKMFHYNHEAHSSDGQERRIKDYYYNRCSMQKAQTPSGFMRINWIRPEDLYAYEAVGINHFKIQGRQNVVNGNLPLAVEAYFKKSFNGNLMDLLTLFAPYNSFQPNIQNDKLEKFIERFVTEPDFCQGVCAKCQYCQKFASDNYDLRGIEELNEKALSFFQAYDKYGDFITRQTNTL